jgi:NAD-dependent deacetylase
MADRIVILTGAGVSAESGLPTFRATDGLWEGHRIEDVATPEAFQRQPALVQQFYNQRRAALKTVQPNAAHVAIARLQREWPGQVTLVTQNVDDLHERGGSPAVLHMHGELLSARCLACGKALFWNEDLGPDSTCRRCRESGELRPDIVWFGEMPYCLDAIYTALEKADQFIAIGTSGKVYPAAGFVSTAARLGARTIEFNLQLSDTSDAFDEHRVGQASVEVPRWVESLLD